MENTKCGEEMKGMLGIREVSSPEHYLLHVLSSRPLEKLMIEHLNQEGDAAASACPDGCLDKRELKLGLFWAF